jgi:hypothetical protein
MRDNLRQYRAIRDALIQGYPGEPQGQCARHLTTLAALISGIVASTSTQLPTIAAKVPDGSKPESRVKRFARWVGNDHITIERYFVPYAEVLLAHLALQTLVLVINGSVVGRGCVALMIHVVYKGRALPLAWMVRRGKKGHFPEALHLTLLEQVQEFIAPGAQVVRSGYRACTAVGGHSPWRCPAWPGCPPALRAVVGVERWRRFLDGLAKDGGRWEVVASCGRRASSAATRSWRSWRCTRSCGTVRREPCTAGGVCSQSCGEKGKGHAVLSGAEG